MKKRIFAAICASAMALSLAACGSASTAPSESQAAPSSSSEAAAPVESTAPAETGSDFDLTQDITPISREDGSGTRGAFVELTGVEKKDESGKKVDRTTPAAAIQNSTNGVMTTVANDETAIGYISLGSLNADVKAVMVDGAEANAENVANGSYTLARPFNIVTNGEPTDALAVDFLGYLMSADAQTVISDAGYIGGEGADYTSTQPAGSITVGGSTSVSPLMEKLIEAYKAVNPNATINLLTSDSTTGVTGAMDGSYTIGMASRELKEEEAASGATATVLAMDGIAVIVNNANPTADLSVEQIMNIFIGELTTWADVQ